ncbi:hypothetical protein CY35_20G013600 [Sphagnum magellanicum]|nr:hypothetical protein CY35_20G013600 [Sphagnum magellanicum]
MTIRLYKAYTPGTRNRSVSGFEEIVRSNPQKKLTYGQHNKGGHNNRGVITSRHRGGEYDPNCNANICLTHYEDGEKRYILHPRGIKIGGTVISSIDAPILVGNALPLSTTIHNVEITPGRGGQLVRAASSVAKLIAKGGRLATLRLPSGEVRLISQDCLATIGQVGHVDANNRTIGKAGSKRWLGKRPRVRGVVMNPVDHPHGGGEGRAPIGREKPLTPWGRTALGKRTRKSNKYNNYFILRCQ